MQERQVIPSLSVEMGHHALGCGSTFLGWRSYGAMKMEERECGWLERKRCLKASAGSIIVCNRGVSLRVTPHPPFIDFLGF